MDAADKRSSAVTDDDESLQVAMETERAPNPVSAAPELRLVLLGRKGTGKSAAGNTILGSGCFESGRPTEECVKRRGEVLGRKVTVVDSPGWEWYYRLNSTPNWVRRETLRSVSLCPPGPHAVLLAVRSCAAVTDAYILEMEEHLRPLGPSVWDHAVVLFTRGDEVGMGTVRRRIRGAALQNLLRRCGNRYHVVNNLSGGDGTQVAELMRKLEEMLESKRDGERYLEMENAAVLELEEDGWRRARERTKKQRQMEEKMQRGTIKAALTAGDDLEPSELDAHQSFSKAPRRLSEIRLVLLGERETGKSSAGNAVLGSSSYFQAGLVTEECVRRQGEVWRRLVTVVDTPGWEAGVAGGTPERVKREMASSVALCPPGPHAILLTLRLDTLVRAELVREHVELLGDGVWRHTMLLFTHADQLRDGVDVQQHIQAGGPDLRWLLDKCRGRHHVMAGQSGDGVQTLLEKVETMASMNRCEAFSSLVQEVRDLSRQKNEKFNQRVKQMSDKMLRQDAELKSLRKREMTRIRWFFDRKRKLKPSGKVDIQRDDAEEEDEKRKADMCDLEERIRWLTEDREREIQDVSVENDRLRIALKQSQTERNEAALKLELKEMEMEDRRERNDERRAKLEEQQRRSDDAVAAQTREWSGTLEELQETIALLRAERNEWMEKVNDLKVETEEAKRRCRRDAEQMKETLKETEAKLHGKDQRISEEISKNRRKQEESDKLLQEKADLIEQIKRKNEEIKTKQKEITALEEQLRKESEKTTRLEEKYLETTSKDKETIQLTLGKELESLRRRHDDELKELKVTEAKRAEESERRRKEKEEELEEARRLYDEAVKEVENVKEELARETREKQRAIRDAERKRSAQIEETKLKHSDQIEELKTRLGKEIDKREAIRKGLEDEIRDKTLREEEKEKRLREKDGEMEEMRLKLRQSEEKEKDGENVKREMEGEIKKLQQRLKEREEEILRREEQTRGEMTSKMDEMKRWREEQTKTEEKTAEENKKMIVMLETKTKEAAQAQSLLAEIEKRQREIQEVGEMLRRSEEREREMTEELEGWKRRGEEILRREEQTREEMTLKAKEMERWREEQTKTEEKTAEENEKMIKVLEAKTKESARAQSLLAESAVEIAKRQREIQEVGETLRRAEEREREMTEELEGWKRRGEEILRREEQTRGEMTSKMDEMKRWREETLRRSEEREREMTEELERCRRSDEERERENVQLRTTIRLTRAELKELTEKMEKEMTGLVRHYETEIAGKDETLESVLKEKDAEREKHEASLRKSEEEAEKLRRKERGMEEEAKALQEKNDGLLAELHALTEREEEFSAKRKEVQDLEAALESRGKKLQEQEKSERDERARAKRTELELRSLLEALEAKREELNRHGEELQEKLRALKHHGKELRERERSLKDQEEALRSKETRLHQWEQSLEERTERLNGEEETDNGVQEEREAREGAAALQTRRLDPEAELKVLILGESWSSRSPSGISIFGGEATVSQGNAFRSWSGAVAGRRLAVVEPLGLKWRDGSDPSRRKDVVSLCRPDVILLLIPSFLTCTPKLRSAVEEQVSWTGAAAWRRVLVLLTWGEVLGESGPRHVGRNGELRRLVERCGGRSQVMTSGGNKRDVTDLIRRMEETAARATDRNQAELFI